jgi:hypothetical protein
MISVAIPIEDRPSWARSSAVLPALRLGAQLAELHQALAKSPITGLLADRAGLLTAANVLARSGRPEGLAELRDIRMMGDAAGPAAPVLTAWSWLGSLPWEDSAATRFRPRRDDDETDDEAADRRHHTRLQDLVRSFGLRDASVAEDLALALGGAAALPCPLASIAAALDAGAGLPPPVQLLASDYAFGRCLGWPLPLYSLGLGRRDTPDPTQTSIARTLLAGIDELVGLLRPLAVRANALIAAGRQVRTRQAPAVVERILSKDAVSAASLTDLLPDRPARRLLQRLVDLGSLRELSGRPIYRVYGL